MAVAEREALSKDRGSQPLWVWLMVLTAHAGRCVYCDEKPSETLEHEVPLTSEAGREVWWNLVPACDRCNGWKSKKSAARWVADMKLHHDHPKVGFVRNALPRHAVEGIKNRVAQVQREIQDAPRRTWFERHYGDMRTPRLRREKHEEVARCTKALTGYPYPPWESPEARHSEKHCMRILCCGYHQKGSRVEVLTLPEADHEDLKRMAYAKGLWLGDLLGALLKPAIEEWRQSQAAGEDEDSLRSA
ncbi:HNH endonuclease [Streptomyces tanashiensis]|uniref:HNH endonuclease n=1 Tax=Streptomyces tanashiensis TaxID=67367 RepID=UPI0036E453DA